MRVSSALSAPDGYNRPGVRHMLIQTAEDYEAALRRFDTLFPAIMGSPTANELDALAAQIEAYEHRLLKAVLPPPRSGSSPPTSWRRSTDRLSGCSTSA